MGTCYSNLSQATELLKLYSDQPISSTLTKENEIYNICLTTSTETLTNKPKIDLINQTQFKPVDLEFSGQEHSKLSRENLKIDKLLNKERRDILKCDINKIVRNNSPKCLNSNKISKAKSRSQSLSSSNSSTPTRNTSALQKANRKQEHKKKRFYQKLKTLIGKQSQRSASQVKTNQVKHPSPKITLNDEDLTIEFISEPSKVLDSRDIETSFVKSYQVSFIPEVSELVEVISSSCSSEADDETQSEIKKKSFFGRFHLNKSGRFGRKIISFKGNEKIYKNNDSNIEKQDNYNRMSQLKPPSVYISSSNNPSGGSTAFGDKISGFVRKKTEQFQQKLNNSNNNQQEANNNNNNNNGSNKNIDFYQHQSKLLPPTNIKTSDAGVNSIFRQLRSRIPSSKIAPSKSTGNVNGAVSSQVGKTSKKNTDKNNPTQLALTDSTSCGNLIKPISAPTLSSTASSCSSSSSSLNNQNSRLPKLKSSKSTSSNYLPPTEPTTKTTVATTSNESMIGKAKFKTQVTATKTMLTTRAQVVPVVTCNTSNQSELVEKQQVTSTKADMNRIGIPIKPHPQLTNRQQQRLNFLYGNIANNHQSNSPILPRIIGSNISSNQQYGQNRFGYPSAMNDSIQALRYPTKTSIISNDGQTSAVNSSMAYHSSARSNLFKMNYGSNAKTETSSALGSGSLAYSPYSRNGPHSITNRNQKTNRNGMIPICNSVMSYHRSIPATIVTANTNLPSRPVVVTVNTNTNSLKTAHTMHPKPAATLEDFLITKNSVNNKDSQTKDESSVTRIFKNPVQICNDQVANIESNSEYDDILVPTSKVNTDTADNGTFSGCSSSSMVGDDDDLSTCSVRTDDLFPVKNSNQNQSIAFSSSNGSHPLSASICSTASTTSSFVFDAKQRRNHLNNHNRAGSTSTSSCSNRDLFLIDDEISDQPALLISNESNQETKQTILKTPYLPSTVGDENNWNMSPSKTLTPTTTSSTNTITTVSNQDSPIVSVMANKNNSSITESMWQSLNHELENLIIQTKKIDQISSSNESDANTSQNQQNSSGRVSKLKKRHSYTSSSSASSTPHHVFRRPRPLSFVENDDGSFGLDSPSLRAVAQDLIAIKTLLFRLQNVLQNAETQNPFEHLTSTKSPIHLRSSHDSSFIPNDKNGSNSEQTFETIDSLKQENFDLRQHCQLLEQQLIEKDRTIRLLQQQMAKYSTVNYNMEKDMSNDNRNENCFLHQLNNINCNKRQTNSTTQTEPMVDLANLRSKILNCTNNKINPVNDPNLNDSNGNCGHWIR